ncbi:MAG: hypothetical protein J5819_07565 [Eubacterium sp.]|nr:hypothetical protein [Eubacterium sp.]
MRNNSLHVVMKRCLAAFLVLVMAVGFAPGIRVATAATKKAYKKDLRITPAVSKHASGSDKVGQYDLSVVETDYLTSHTEQSNVLTDAQVKAIFGADSVTGSQKVGKATSDDLTFSEEMYRKLGLVKENEDVVKNLQDMRDDKSNQNILAGMTKVDPEELMIGEINKTKARQGAFFTVNNMDNVTDISTIDSDLEKLDRNASFFNIYEDDLNKGEKKYQCHNMVGIDADGDGLDELAYLGIYYDKIDKKKQCFVDIELFKRQYVTGTLFNGQEYSSWDWVSQGKIVSAEPISDKDNDFVSEMEVRSDLAYTSMAVGNFDGKDDGREELAFYLPSKKKTSGRIDARVRVLSFGDNYKVAKTQDVYLRDINDKFGYMDKDWRLPIVSLSTTQTRLGDKIKDQSQTISRYKTHDDLVIGVSVPGVYRKEYNDRNLPLNSWLAIYSFENGTTPLFKKELTSYKDGDTYSRMLGINACDADLNGDGYKNLVVAGVKEEGISDGNAHSYGTASDRKNLVSVLYVDKSGNYNFLWSNPREVKAPGNLDVNNFTKADKGTDTGSVLAPIALCAGHYLPDGPEVLEQLCIQGVILSAEKAKVSGVPASESKDKNGTVVRCVLTDTEPYCEPENLRDMSFNDVYTYDISSDDTDDATTQAWVFAVYSGQLLNGSGTDTICLLSSDVRPTNHDHVYIDVNLISYCNSNDSSVAGFHYKAYDNYMNLKDEDGDGTSLFAGFVNTDLDTFYYRYTGTGSSLSAPVLQSIVQAPPYYEESNGAGASYSVSSGYSREHNLGFDLSVGVFAGYEEMFKIEAELIGTFGTHWGWSNEVSTTQTLEVPCDDDYAVVLAVPIVENYYDVLSYDENTHSFVKGERVVTSMLSPIYTSLKLNTYNEIIESEAKKSGTDINVEASSPLIDVSKLPKSSAGNPNGYVTALTDILNSDDLDDGKIEETDTEKVEVKNSVDENGGSQADIDFSHGNSREMSGEVSFTLQIGCKYVAGIGGIAGGYARCNTTTTGTGFSIDYDKLSNPVGGELSFVKNEKYKGMSSAIYHFGDSELSYNYSSTAVAYPLSARDGVVKNRDAIKDDLLDSIHVLSFYVPVKGNPMPPEQPSAAALQSININADGSIDVVLGWESSVRDAGRCPDGYNIYRKDSNDILHLVNVTEGPVLRRTESDYTTYTVNIPSADRNENDKEFEFYIVPAYVKYINGETQVKEGIPVKCCSVSNESPENKNLVITGQPQMVYTGDDLSGKTASFSVEISIKEKLKDRDVFYTWETYDSKTKTWNPVSATTVDEKELAVGDTGKITNTNTFTITDNLADMLDIPIRCTVDYGSYSYLSNIVAVEKEPFGPVKVSSITFEDPGHLKATVASPKNADSVCVQVSTDKNFKKDVKSKLITDFKNNKAKVSFKGLNKNKKYYLTTIPCKGMIEGEKGKVYTINPKKLPRINRNVLKKALLLKVKKKAATISFEDFKKLKKKYDLTAANLVVSTDKAGKKEVAAKTLKNKSVNVKKLKKNKKYYLSLQCFMKSGIIKYLSAIELHLKKFKA